MPTPTEQDLHAALSAQGLSLRGGFAPVATDGLAPLPDGKPVAVVWMVGVIGSTFWPHFKASHLFSDGLADPLDRWSRAIGEELAARFGGRALFPFDGPPYHPFQRWADRAEATQASRMMLRIHPEHGLWHAYRFALALPTAPRALHDAAEAGISAPEAGTVDLAGGVTLPTSATDLCATCSGQPCLQACPVGAYTGESFLLDACASHLHSVAGAECMQSGCLARRACPVAPDKRYSQEHAAFHMQAFARNH
jgi:hypothetical protein